MITRLLAIPLKPHRASVRGRYDRDNGLTVTTKGRSETRSPAVVDNDGE